MKSLDKIIAYFTYDPLSPGCLHTTFPANIYIEKKGYWVVKIKKEYYKAHRIVYKLNYKDFDESLFIDHIDGVKTNNIISNLRCVTHAENMKNKKLYDNNKTGHVGITKRTIDGIEYLRVYVRHDNKLNETFLNVSKFGGYDACLTEAIKIRQLMIESLNFSERHGNV